MHCVVFFKKPTNAGKHARHLFNQIIGFSLYIIVNTGIKCSKVIPNFLDTGLQVGDFWKISLWFWISGWYPDCILLRNSAMVIVKVWDWWYGSPVFSSTHNFRIFRGPSWYLDMCVKTSSSESLPVPQSTAPHMKRGWLPWSGYHYLSRIYMSNSHYKRLTQFEILLSGCLFIMNLNITTKNHPVLFWTR